MEFIRGRHNLAPRHRGCAITIGNYDGVHLGHQAVIRQLVQRARALGAPAAVVVFEPQPLEFLRPQVAPARLMRITDKVEALGRLDVDRALCMHFDRELAALSAEAFIDEILVKQLGVRYLVVGEDFRFGAERRGDFAMLVEAGRRLHFETASTPTLLLDGERVSSTRVRQTLARDDFPAAEKLLGHRYSICGRVAHGNKLGRTLGVPTANIHLHRRRMPLVGIFVVEIELDGSLYPGVASIGSRPTIDGTQVLLEAHLFDFNRDIYGSRITVIFLHKLRDEKRFDSLEALKDAMAEDIRRSKDYFAQRDAAGAAKPL
jgi:riboflavin kinase/FMN adenylyltransferase